MSSSREIKQKIITAVLLEAGMGFFKNSLLLLIVTISRLYGWDTFPWPRSRFSITPWEGGVRIYSKDSEHMAKHTDMYFPLADTIPKG